MDKKTRGRIYNEKIKNSGSLTKRDKIFSAVLFSIIGVVFIGLLVFTVLMLMFFSGAFSF